MSSQTTTAPTRNHPPSRRGTVPRRAAREKPTPKPEPTQTHPHTNTPKPLQTNTSTGVSKTSPKPREPGRNTRTAPRTNGKQTRKTRKTTLPRVSRSTHRGSSCQKKQIQPRLAMHYRRLANKDRRGRETGRPRVRTIRIGVVENDGSNQSFTMLTQTV